MIKRQGEISRWKLVLLFIEMKRNKEGRWGKKRSKEKEKKMKKKKVGCFMGGVGVAGKEDNPKWHYH